MQGKLRLYREPLAIAGLFIEATFLSSANADEPDLLDNRLARGLKEAESRRDPLRQPETRYATPRAPRFDTTAGFWVCQNSTRSLTAFKNISSR